MSYRRFQKGGRGGFSRGQQPELRRYLALAWAEVCGAAQRPVEARCAKGKRCGDAAGCAYCAWYESVLVGATGHKSTTACNATEDYERLMGALEEIHGTAIVWQVKRDGGNVRRLEWLLGDALPGRRFSLGVIRGVARRALRLERAPDLERLTKEERQTVLEALKSMDAREVRQSERMAEGDGEPDWTV
jgi:hypothetical protein